jgi:hypothetical protein
MSPDKDYEYALKLIKKNKIIKFYEKFNQEDLVILHELGAISDKKFYKFVYNRHHNKTSGVAAWGKIAMPIVKGTFPTASMVSQIVSTQPIIPPNVSLPNLSIPIRKFNV